MSVVNWSADFRQRLSLRKNAKPYQEEPFLSINYL